MHVLFAKSLTNPRRIPMFSRLVLPSVLLAGLLPIMAHAADRPVVVELFTSQGCSSCPPANAYLNEMVRQRRDVLALAFHVTYWDRLGWKDPFSMAAATDRQAVYARRFGDGSYTPEMVVDGAISMVGSDRERVGPSIERAKRESETAASVNVTRNGEQLAIEVGAGKGSGRVLLIGFDHEHTTAVRHGENGGRSLTEANVVRSMRAVGQWSGSVLRLNERFPEGQDIAVVLEAPDGRIIGASRLGAGST